MRKYTPEEQMAMELVISLSAETPAPMKLIKDDFDWDGNDVSTAISAAGSLGIKVVRERGCLFIALHTWPLAKAKGNEYYNAVYGNEG